MSIKQLDVAAKYIEIVPIGNINEEVIHFLEEVVGLKFGLSTKISKEIPVPATAYNRSRNQYNSRAVLSEVEARKKQKNKCVFKAENEISMCELETRYLAIINDDLYTNGLNYVFGQAILNGCCGVISLSRLCQSSMRFSGHDKDLFYSRVKKEAVHELGHVFGLRHCPNPECVMYLSGNIADTDRKSANFCSVCDN